MSEQPQDLQGWVAFLSSADIPVLKHTAREIGHLQEHEDDLGARAVANVVVQDPLFTVKLLRYLLDHKHSRQLRDLVQVEQVIMMLGLNTFFNAVPHKPVVEDVLHDHLDALVNLLRTVRRAQRAAHYAFDWALLLHDLHAEEVRVAALLSSMAELLMWCFAPGPMLEIRRRQDADKTLRSATVQEEVLGFKGVDLQRALAEAWHLPPLLQNLMNPLHAENERVKNVALAISLARHSANGWDDAALPDDYRDISALLGMDIEKVKEIVGANPTPDAPPA